MNTTDHSAAQLDALRLSSALRRRLVDFCCDVRYSRDPDLSRICREIWEGAPDDGGLVSDLWVEGAFPAKPSDATLKTLAEDGVFDSGLVRVLHDAGAVPENRPLYEHQKEAILRCQQHGSTEERPALVVTARTGTGKTECFLLPMLNDLFKHPSVPGSGMKCLILYPMNALVNDQVDRLFDWLHGQSKVRLFHFTSETPEDRKVADRNKVPEWSACRFRTRREARGEEDRQGKRIVGGPIPDIVITNYSMLEYMLCRPQDAVFFGSALRTVVLDEAHLYTGTLAAEITLLLRRLYARCGVDPANVLQIATSATLGSGADDELRQFAATVFTKKPEQVDVIVGESERAPLPAEEPPNAPVTAEAMTRQEWIDRPFVVADQFGNAKLATDAEYCERLATQLPLLTSHPVDSQDSVPAKLLWEVLSRAPMVHKLEDTLWHRRRLPLVELASELWEDNGPDAQKATVTLLQLTASARPTATAYPLVPHRLHLLVRPPAGLSVCLSRTCTGPAKHKLNGLGTVTGGVMDRCPHCQAATLLLYRCQNCGQWILAGVRDGNRYRATIAPRHRLSFLTTTEVSDGSLHTLTLNDKTGERSGHGAAGVQVQAITACAGCGEDQESFQPFESGGPLTLAIVAETLLAELPNYPAALNRWLPARGRRLLAFSDSRREAARLGPRLTRQHETQLLRAAIARALSENLAADQDTIDYLGQELERIETHLRTASTPALRERLQQELEGKRKQLETHEAGGSIREWATSIGQTPLLAELLDAETAYRHVAGEQQPDGTVRSWSQKDWEDNWDGAKKKITVLLGSEFSTRSSRTISSETIGLAEVTYPGIDRLQIPDLIVGLLPNVGAQCALEGAWPDVLRSLCDTLRAEGVVELDADNDAVFQTGGVPIGRWAAKHHTGWQLVRFVGSTPRQMRRRFLSAILEACPIAKAAAEELAPRILEVAFDQLLDRAQAPGEPQRPEQLSWLERHERQTYDSGPVSAIRIIFSALGVRRPPSLFRCTKTHHVWPRSILGCAPEMGCNGTLQAVSEDQLDKDPRLGRLRQEYRQSHVFSIGLWAEEHSAQLSPRENRRLQDLFKAGIRNVLSATTTLELGIDIGGLSAVLLSNVPPGKANYLQRAGRAGRRADGSAAVVTFARSRSFDREVFSRFGDYLDQPLRKPRVFLDRQRVVRRHLHAHLLGEFFRSRRGPGERRGAMDAFGSMGTFCGKPVVPYWKDKRDKPALGDAPSGLVARFRKRLIELRDHGDGTVQAVVTDLFAGSGLQEAATDWPKLIGEVIDSLDRAIKHWNDDYDRLCNAWLGAVDDDNKAQANAIYYQLKLLSELTVIEALADRQFLPRYGFPIGLQKLRVIVPDPKDSKRVREEDQLRLERASMLAVAEYVPGSQLLVGGKVITSRGLLKHWTGASLDGSPGLRGHFCHCENNHSYYGIAGEPDQCPICDGERARSPQRLLFVKYGFTSAAWDPPRASVDVERIGAAERLCITTRSATSEWGQVEENFAGIIGLCASYREDGELLVFNRGEHHLGFAICLRCGYAESEVAPGHEMKKLPKRFDRHAPISSPDERRTCLRDDDPASVMRNHILAARETTDILLMDFTGCLRDRAADPLITTLAWAFRNAGARLLELDPRELGVLAVPTGPKGTTRGFVIYDNVPGGAGHVRELLDQGKEWIHEAYKVLWVNEAHDQRCESGCLDCLLSFDTQTQLEDQTFVRREACELLREFRNQSR